MKGMDTPDNYGADAAWYHTVGSWFRYWRWGILPCLAAMLLWACFTKRPTVSEVAGNYHATFGKFDDFIQVHADGTFDQTITWEGKKVTGHGTWEIDGPEGFRQMLYFKSIYRVIDMNGGHYDEPVLDSHEAVWVDYQGHAISFDVERGDVVAKIEK